MRSEHLLGSMTLQVINWTWVLLSKPLFKPSQQGANTLQR